jgi:dihydrolipoamide dehydrogenase
MRIAVIGGGPGGYVAAIKAAMMGAEVTVIEAKRVGGTCLNVGCIPTKSLLASCDALEIIREAEDFGIDVNGEVKPNLEVIIDRKNKIVDRLVEGIEFLFEKRGVKLINGFGKLIDKNRIEVTKAEGEKEIVEADKIILATGSVPVIPPIFPYDGDKVITSDEALSLKKVPESMIIIGGGIIGCELGQFFRKMGTKVTIIEMLNQLISFEDEDVIKQLERQFKKDKIKVITGKKIESCEVKDDKVFVHLNDGTVLEAEKLLVGAGRRAFLENLGIEDIGIETNRGRIVVNEKMETNIEGIYAIGDIVDSPQLAHVASKEGMIAVENAMGKNKKVDYRAVPRCVFTEPEIAAVGYTEKQLKEKGMEYKVGKFDFRSLGKAQAMNKLQGFVKIIADIDDKIIGASIVGPHATDLLAELTLAVQLGLTVEQVGDVIHPHPTLSEALMEALHAVHGQCVHAI